MTTHSRDHEKSRLIRFARQFPYLEVLAQSTLHPVSEQLWFDMSDGSNEFEEWINLGSVEDFKIMLLTDSGPNGEPPFGVARWFSRDVPDLCFVAYGRQQLWEAGPAWAEQLVSH